MQSLVLVVLSSILLPMANAQTPAPDGLLVPFTSALPACATLCGPLFDVQGACVPPQTSPVSKSCFCADPRLKSFTSSTASISKVCGVASCQDVASLQKIQNWYETFCNLVDVQPTKTGGTTSGSTNAPNTVPRPTVYPTWFESHWKWVVALILMVFGITGAWIGAIFLRKRYLRKKELEYELRPPVVAWGPHQMQGATGGHGVVDPSVGGHSKESVVKPRTAKKSWLKKERP